MKKYVVKNTTKDPLYINVGINGSAESRPFLVIQPGQEAEVPMLNIVISDADEYIDRSCE